MKIEYVHRNSFYNASALHRAAMHDAEIETEGRMVPVVRLEELEDLVQKWRAQTGARESISFRLAMRKLEKFVDDLRVGRHGDED